MLTSRHRAMWIGAALVTLTFSALDILTRSRLVRGYGMDQAAHDHFKKYLDRYQSDINNLERRRGTAGRDRVDHRPGSHDDRANAAAGALALAAARDAAAAAATARWALGVGADEPSPT